jgi:iron complex transport system ATP-binding protein
MGLLRRLTRERPLAVLVSTHDLELALRTADAIWLIMPGGELVTGAPEDVVLSGAIGEAFEGRQIRFHQEERSFRLLTGDGGDASVHGAGLRGALAAAVLEREGYAVVATGAAALNVRVDDNGWRLSTGDSDFAGADFASLAECLRGRRTVS